MSNFSDIKIAFLTPEYPHPRTPCVCGGIGTSIMNLAHEMVNTGASVSILIYGQEQDEVFEENGITFYRIHNNKNKRFGRYLTQRKIEKLINALVRKNKVNVVEAPDWTGITSFIRPKCPVVIKLHSSETVLSHFRTYPIKKMMVYNEKRALRKANGLTSVSKFIADISNKIFGLDKQFTILHNGIDLAKFTPSSEKTKENTILYFGTLVRNKGSLELAQIFNLVFEADPTAKLVLVGTNGNDPTTNNMSVWDMMKELLTKEALANVTYHGSVPYEEMKDYINEASICAFPSFVESFGLSWIEAMAMEKPIVASNIGSAKEVVAENKEGFLADPKDHRDFADKITQLLKDRELRLSFGKAARKRVENQFSTQAVAERNLIFYRDLIQKQKF